MNLYDTVGSMQSQKVKNRMDGLSNAKLPPSKYPYSREVVRGNCSLCERNMPLVNLTYRLCLSCFKRVKKNIIAKLGWYDKREIPLAIKEYEKDRSCRFCGAKIPFMKGNKYNPKLNDICDTCMIPYKVGLQAGYKLRRRRRAAGHYNISQSMVNSERMSDVSFVP